MPRSLLLPTALSSAVLAAAVLASCDPICLDGVSPPEPGREYQNVSGTCVAVVVTSPDSGGSNDGTDAGEDPDAGPGEQACGKSGWTTWVVDEGLDVITAGFAFDAQGVGHYAYSKNSRLYVGTTRPGDGPAQAGDVSPLYDVHMAVAVDGTHHVLFQQGDSFGYAHDTGGVWRSQLLGKGRAGAIALDPQGAPHLLVEQPGSERQTYVHGAIGDGGTWTLNPLPVPIPLGDRERLAVDAAGHLHAVFLLTLGLDESQVVYASNTSGTWATEPLDWMVPLGSPRLRVALQVDADGRPALLGSNNQGAWLWRKEDSGWKARGLGPFMSRGPALQLGPGDQMSTLLDDADPFSNVDDSSGQLVVQSLTESGRVGSTPPLTLETLDGGNARASASAVYEDLVDGRARRQVGFTYVRFFHPKDGGTSVTTRGLRYARYCP
ncbi:hypothetical protein [Corallococcus sp. Z5C101001]|uniref:hypothetical protein n=1 Tax=Corallococcus sp. Z5C101001 TaxID=2596829 RepID=UPI00117EF946|nr:hypothetical protein [Corallococcus sp. Z5C101001]TSC29554.1 hypothetical protein FOF48_16790 [Corallococcus sp. Z5C101001]